MMLIPREPFATGGQTLWGAVEVSGTNTDTVVTPALTSVS